MSTTVAKALSLLDHFSEAEPEIGLSELARRSGVDKATVHRMLGVMCDAGLLEKRGDARLYRLGAGVLRLARVREAAFPVSALVQQSLAELAARLGETAHASLISGRGLATIGICESNRGSRVSLVAGEILMLHCTASGLAVLAYSRPERVDRVLAEPLVARTTRTITNPGVLRARLEEIRLSGFAEADQTAEDDVYGIAVPLFDSDGEATGAIAIATPAHRMTNDLRQEIITALIAEAERVTVSSGGRVPATFRAAAARFVQV
ncbi:IclR family transcriptional regulator [Tabrizicola thermarum]|uniref:IclR family transcriptional regulator n=1 Tax=Tabrizicola thermarum TaxID=2670345 RepID=UPI000FFBA25E|nr:IclR family transcriptional regulator [Tabrizicola thermarum]